jgi:hypothetical protein
VVPKLEQGEVVGFLFAKYFSELGILWRYFRHGLFICSTDGDPAHVCLLGAFGMWNVSNPRYKLGFGCIWGMENQEEL